MTSEHESYHSENISAFLAREIIDALEGDDTFTYIVKGFVHLESLVNSLLAGCVLIPAELDLDAQGFNRKVHLAIAVGVIHDDVGAVLLQLAKVRNQFAHQLWPKYSSREERDFLNAARKSDRIRTEYDSHFQDDGWHSGIRLIIYTLWHYLFAQVCKLAQNRGQLNVFWRGMVDAAPAQDQGITLLEVPHDAMSDELRKVYRELIGKLGGSNDAT